MRRRRITVDGRCLRSLSCPLVCFVVYACNWMHGMLRSQYPTFYKWRTPFFWHVTSQHVPFSGAACVCCVKTIHHHSLCLYSSQCHPLNFNSIFLFHASIVIFLIISSCFRLLYNGVNPNIVDISSSLPGTSTDLRGSLFSNCEFLPWFSGGLRRHGRTLPGETQV